MLLYPNISEGYCNLNQWRIQDFPEGGARQPERGGANLLFDQFFSENCMKMKKFWSRGGGALPCAPLRSATANVAIYVSSWTNSRNTDRPLRTYQNYMSMQSRQMKASAPFRLNQSPMVCAVIHVIKRKLRRLCYFEIITLKRSINLFSKAARDNWTISSR